MAVAELKHRRRLTADVSLLMVTLIWGTTFVVVKTALADIGPFWFIGTRFLLAFAVLALIYYRRLLKTDNKHWKISAIVGLVLFAGYTLQTVGLQYTTAANSGFITGLSVVLVPIVGRWWGQSKPNTAALIGIGCAALGLGLLTLNDGLHLNAGDLFTFFAAIALACHVVLVGHYAPRIDAVVLAVLQIGMVGIAGLAAGLLFERTPVTFSYDVWVALAVTAIPATAIALLLQNIMQQYTTPVRTAVIFAMEPVFAGLAAYLLLGEFLTIKQLLGCGLIITGMLLSELG